VPDKGDYFVWTDEERKKDAKAVINDELGYRVWGIQNLMNLTGASLDTLMRNASQVIIAENENQYTSAEFDARFLLNLLEETCGFDDFADALIQEHGYAFWIDSMDGSEAIEEPFEDYFIHHYS
jgi:hypothetical protein